MKGLCVYIKAGKGHYVPARAVNEQMEAVGVESQLVDFFDYLDIHSVEDINQGIWRLMLRFPFIERRFVKMMDQSEVGIKFFVWMMCKLRKKKFLENLKEFRPDFIFTTHPYPETVFARLSKKLGLNIPVYYYATDVFTSPASGIWPEARCVFIATEEGRQRLIEKGASPDFVRICPFPLQSSVASVPHISKKEARKKLGLKEDVFTIQLNLGGEGLGSLSLLESILKEDLPVQVVVIGGIREEMKLHLNLVISSNKTTNASVEIRGFIDNVNDYLAASDVIVGRAGINTIVEAIYAHRPFLITELVYTVLPSAEFVEKYHVGWNASDDKDKQIGIIHELLENPEKLDEIDKAFDAVPIEYSARKLAEIVKNDAEIVRSGLK